MPLNIILASITYNRVRLLARFSPVAREILAAISGIEASLFLWRPIFEKDYSFRKKFVSGFVGKIVNKQIPLTNGQHGVRVHGLTEATITNRINYFENAKKSRLILAEQIRLTKRLAEISGIDDQKFPSILTVHVGQRCRDHKTDIKILTQTLSGIADLARENRVFVNLETTRWDYFSHQNFGTDLSDFSQILEKLDQPQKFVGITFDTAHSLIGHDGDYEKIKNDLSRYGLLPYINYLHVVPPDAKYKSLQRENFSTGAKFPWPLIQYLFLPDGDSHISLPEFFKNCTGEQTEFLNLIKFLIKKTQVTSKPFGVINFEVGPKIPGLGKGANNNDILESIKLIKKCHVNSSLIDKPVF